MSHSHPTAASSSPSSSNFQLIFNNALKAYQQRTKKNLLSHPLAAQLQTCESPSDILAVLQQQVGGLDQSQSGDDRWTKWLDPTINVLLAFSDTVGAGVGLVCPRTCGSMRFALIYTWQVFSPATVIFAGIGVLLSVCIRPNLVWGCCNTFSRQPRMFGQAKILLWISLSVSTSFLDVSKCIQKCR